MATKKVVIIGGGFAGINLAEKLAGKKELQVTLMDKNNYNFFPPLLYQVSTGMLDVSSISIPFRTLLKGKKNINFRLGELLKVRPSENVVELSTGELTYDFLVIAAGTKSNYFGMENIEKNSLPMKTIDDAVKLRNYLILQAEKYTFIKDEAEKRKIENIVISGAGPSGVEVAGMIAEMRSRVLGEIFPELSKTPLHIYLVDGAATVLPPMSRKSQEYTLESLEKMGVIVKLNKLVSDYKDDVVYFKDGETIETKTLIWTAGVTAIRFEGLPDESYEKGNRLAVDQYGKVAHTQNIFAIGDSSIQYNDPDFPKGYPQLGSVAQQQGKNLAKNLAVLARGNGSENNLKPFKYTDKGTMAIIGKKRAVADLTFPKATLTGFPAWFAWLFIHLFLLIDYRNRLRTMINWAGAYLNDSQSNGLMQGENVTDSLQERVKVQ